MKVLLLLPVLVYLALILVNLDFARSFQEINFFGAKTLNGPFVLYSSMFIVAYSFLVFVTYDGINLFLRYKIKKQDKEIVALKSKLYEGQSDIIKKISKEIEGGLKEIKKENKENIKTLVSDSEEKVKKLVKKSDEKLEEYKASNKELLIHHGKETDKILGKVNLLDKGILDKIKDSIRG